MTEEASDSVDSIAYVLNSECMLHCTRTLLSIVASSNLPNGKSNQNPSQASKDRSKFEIPAAAAAGLKTSQLGLIDGGGGVPI
jgi:hypothetical protein